MVLQLDERQVNRVLHRCILLHRYQGSEQCLHLMVSFFGPNVVLLRDAQQHTPLHVAALTNSVDCCQILVGHRAPVDEADCKGRTPLICAASRGHNLILGELTLRSRGIN